MSYPSCIEQFCPSDAFDDFLKWSASRPFFRELEPSTQEIIQIARQPIALKNLFFQISLYRIWDSPVVWKIITQATDCNVYAFSFGDAIAALDSSTLKQPQALSNRRVHPTSWNKAGWAPETKHLAAEFHFRSLVKMLDDDIPSHVQNEVHTLQDIEKLLLKYPGVTPPIASGLAQDINYTSYLRLLHSNYLQLSGKAKETIEKCFIWSDKQQKKIIQTLWAWFDECIIEATGQPAPMLVGRKPSLQDIQNALAAYAKQEPPFSVAENPVLPEWWIEEEPPPMKEEVEVIPDQPAPPLKIVATLEDCLEMFPDLEQEGALAFDIETYYPAAKINKDGTRRAAAVKVVTDRFKSKIRLLQLFRKGSQIVWLVDLLKLGEAFTSSAECGRLRQIFAKKTIVGHNIICFDLPWVWVHLRLQASGIHDTYVAHRILTNGMHALDNENSLKYCLANDIGMKLPKNMGSSDWGTPELSDRQICYAAHDVYHMHRLMEYYERMIHAQHNKLGDTWDIEVCLAPIVVKMTNSGNPVDLSRLPEIRADAERRMLEAEQKVRDLLKSPGLNIDAPQQLLRALRDYGFRGKSTDEEALKINGSEASLAVVKYRHVRNRELKFLVIVEEAAKNDPRVHSTFNSVGESRVHSIYDQLGTVTGRFSSKDPNAQNFPRPDKNNKANSVRALFAAPPGKKLVIADFAQMELVIAASVVGEKNMLAALHAGEDLHKKTAAHIQGVDPATIGDKDPARNLGKSCNFGLLYGQSACGGHADYPNGGLRGFARNVYGVELTIDQAVHARDEWFKLYPGFINYHRNGGNLAEAFCDYGFGYVRTHVVGRVQYFLTSDKEIRPLLKHKVFSSLVNTPIQGTSAEIFKLVMIQVNEDLPEAEIINVVHDEIVLLCDNDKADHVISEVGRIMVDSTHIIFPGAPMKADVKSANNWAEK